MDYTVPPFLSKTYEMVDDPSSDEVVSWSVGNNSFVVLKVPEFQKHFLPKYFKHSNFASFVRQLNTYGFRKVHPDRFEFANEWFLRGQKHLLKTIVRKKNGNQPPQVQSSSVASCVEVGKFGLEEEVERLKCDKNVLMQELVRLRQQQQATDHHLQTVGQRVHSMEQRQQQMMSFLAKAMQSPGFLGQLVQQQNESNHRIAGGNKKRRFPRQDEENSVGDNISSSSNGQIIKLHPSVNEAAKAMLCQILKMNSSSRLEPLASNSGPLLLGNLSSSNAMENGSSSSRISELMLAEVLPSSGPSSFPIDPGFPSGHPSNAISSDVQTHPSIVVDRLEANNYTEINAHNYGPEEFLPNFTEMPGNVSGSLSGIPITIPLGPEIGNSDCVDPMSSVHSMTMPGENDAFSTDRDMDILVDEMPKLPSINDVFWEQILTGSPCNVDTDELNSTSPESSMMKEQQWQSWQENGWDKIQRMKDLTEQLELLTSAGTRG